MLTVNKEIECLYDNLTIRKRKAEKLEYIRSLLGELRTMAQAERCEMVAYLIEMAYIEASDILRGVRSPGPSQSSRKRKVA